MTPELYEAIKDILNYNRVDSVQREAGMTGFIGDSHAARQRFERLEKAFALHAPRRQTLVDTWVALRDKAIYSQDARLSFLPATSMIEVKNNTRDGDRSSADESAEFEEYVRDIAMPDLVGDPTGKKLFISRVYGIPYAQIGSLDEKERAESYLKAPLQKDIFPALLEFWKSIGINLAVDHLYILVDVTSDIGILFWKVVAVTRKHIAASAPYEHNAILADDSNRPTVEVPDKGKVFESTLDDQDVLRGGVYTTGIPDFKTSPDNTLIAAVHSAVSNRFSDGVACPSFIIPAVVAALTPGIPLVALRYTTLFIVHEPRLCHSNLHEIVTAHIRNPKARILLTHMYCKESAQFVRADPAWTLSVVLGTPGGDLQRWYEKETLGKQGVHYIHQLVLMIRSGKMNEWALAATLSEGVES